MANYGFTTIVVHGPERDRANLLRELAATARGPLEFTLTGAAPDVWTRDDHMQDATIESAGDVVVLQTCLPWDNDALLLCGSLARRYPSLGFDGQFHCEGTWPDFTVISHSNGAEAYRAHFDVRFVAHLRGGRPGETGHQLPLYPVSPERDAAALGFGPPRLAPFLVRPPVAGGWRRSDHDPEAGACYLRGAEGGVMTALVLDLYAGEGHVLSGVDAHGGYRAAETLCLDRLREMFPELSGEFTKTTVVAPPDWKASAYACAPDRADDLPF